MTATAPAAAPRTTPADTHYGKDHLTLADWPIGVATFQQRTHKNGELRDFATFGIERTDGTRQQVTLESPSRIGLPTAGDKDVLIALLFLAKQQEFRSDIVRFMPWRLLKILRWPENQKSLLRLRLSLTRLKALTATYENAWYSRRTRTVESCLLTGILAEVKLVFRKGRRAAGALPESYVQWTRTVFTSLEEGSLIDLDLDLYFSCTRPAAKDLLRHLNKVWHGGRKPRPYARDLKELACGHLGLTDSKDLKRNFDQLVKELEARNYVQPADAGMRYQKIRPGVWRVHFSLHPEQVRAAKKGKTPSAIDETKNSIQMPDSAAAVLVRRYHQHRFGKQNYHPKPHECTRAAALLKDHRQETLLKVLPLVARTVERTYHNQDVYFGAAVPFIEKALVTHKRQEHIRITQEQQQAMDMASRALVSDQKRERQDRTQKLRKMWAALDPRRQKRYHQQAVDHAGSDFERRRLAKCSLSAPPTETLEIMARDSGVLRGDS